MFKLDNDFLTTLGLGGLPVDEKNKLLQMIYERLEMNVGMRLAEKMDDQQLDDFEAFIDQNDEAGALKWLETNFPNYKDVVAEELEKLKVEVTNAAPHILAAQTSAVAQPVPMMTDPMMPGVPQLQTAPQQPMYAVQPQPAFTNSASQAEPLVAPVTPASGPIQPLQPYVLEQPVQPVAPVQQQPDFVPMAPSQPAPNPVPSFDSTVQAPIQPSGGFSSQPSYGPTPQQVPQPAPGFSVPQQPAQPQQFTPPPSGFNPGQ